MQVRGALLDCIILAQKPRRVSAPFQSDRHASAEARHNPLNTRLDWSETSDGRVRLNIQHLGPEKYGQRHRGE